MCNVTRKRYPQACATITPQTGACCLGDGTLKGAPKVFVVSNRCGAVAALAMAIALSGCGSLDFDTSASWFRKPLDVFGNKGGYTYSNLSDTRLDRPITANDLVDANGACPRMAAPVPTPPGADNTAAGGAASPDMASLLGGGVAIGMSECEVVSRLGQATAVNLGRNPNGDRKVVMTFKTGPRPGVYRFEGGRLSEMDRVEEPAPPPPVAVDKKVAKKKPVKPAKPQQPPNPDNKT